MAFVFILVQEHGALWMVCWGIIEGVVRLESEGAGECEADAVQEAWQIRVGFEPVTLERTRYLCTSA